MSVSVPSGWVGELDRMAQMGRFPVSLLRSQGVKVLGPDLVAEAHADDGLVEAFRWHDPLLCPITAWRHRGVGATRRQPPR